MNLLVIFKKYWLKIIGTFIWVYISLAQISMNLFFIIYYIFYYSKLNINYKYIEYINYFLILFASTLYFYLYNKKSKKFISHIRIHRIRYYIIIQCAIFVFNTGFFAYFYINYFKNNNYELGLEQHLFSSFFSIIITIIGLVLYMLLMMNIKYKELLVLNNRYVSQQKTHYENMLKYYEEARKTQHDNRHHLTVIKAFISNNEIDRAMSYINSSLSKYDATTNLNLCENIVLNSLLLEYKPILDKNNIVLTINGEYPIFIKINDYDLCTIFSNLLLNAIEACSLVKNNRQIFIFFNCYGLYLNFKIKNTFNGTSTNLRTTKKDFHKHGIGLKNVEECIKDNNGNIEFSYQGNMFCVDVLLQGNNNDISTE